MLAPQSARISNRSCGRAIRKTRAGIGQHVLAVVALVDDDVERAAEISRNRTGSPWVAPCTRASAAMSTTYSFQMRVAVGVAAFALLSCVVPSNNPPPSYYGQPGQQGPYGQQQYPSQPGYPPPQYGYPQQPGYP